VTLSRATLDAITLKETTFPEAVQSGLVKIDGNRAKLGELMSMLDTFEPMFPCCRASEVSVSGGLYSGARVFGARAQDTGYSPPRMSPASLLLYFAAGSTRCPVHDGRCCCAARLTSALNDHADGVLCAAK
jgi:hypothetical protein